MKGISTFHTIGSSYSIEIPSSDEYYLTPGRQFRRTHFGPFILHRRLSSYFLTLNFFVI